MRILLIILTLAFVPQLCVAQSPSINKFYRHHKKDDGVQNIKLPGWLIRIGANIATKQTDDPVGAEAVGLAKKVKKMRLLVSESGNPIPHSEIQQFVRDVEAKDGYLPGVRVKQAGQLITVMIREEKDILRGLLILVDSEDQFVMLSMKTKLKIDDVIDLVAAAINDEGGLEEVEVEDGEIVLPEATP